MQNDQLSNVIEELKRLSIKENANIWKRLATDLEKPVRRRRVVNLSRLARFTKEKDMVVVPGKVLGGGELPHSLTVAAFTYSGSAIDKIKKANGQPISLLELMKKNPKGKNIKIIG